MAWHNDLLFIVVLLFPELPLPSLVQTHLVLWREAGKWGQRAAARPGQTLKEKLLSCPCHLCIAYFKIIIISLHICYFGQISSSYGALQTDKKAPEIRVLGAVEKK